MTLGYILQVICFWGLNVKEKYPDPNLDLCQRSRLGSGLRLTAIRRGFELCEWLLVGLLFNLIMLTRLNLLVQDLYHLTSLRDLRPYNSFTSVFTAVFVWSFLEVDWVGLSVC